MVKINLGSRGVVEAEVSDINLDEEEIGFEGKRLTEADAEVLGKQIAARLNGRPFLDPEGEPSIHLGFRVPRSVGSRVDDVARRTGKRRSDVLREAVEAYLVDH